MRAYAELALQGLLWLLRLAGLCCQVSSAMAFSHMQSG